MRCPCYRIQTAVFEPHHCCRETGETSYLQLPTASLRRHLRGKEREKSAPFLLQSFTLIAGSSERAHCPIFTLLVGALPILRLYPPSPFLNTASVPYLLHIYHPTLHAASLGLPTSAPLLSKGPQRQLEKEPLKGLPFVLNHPIHPSLPFSLLLYSHEQCVAVSLGLA